MIPLHSIPLPIRKISEALEKAGFEAYLVGGCVRDLLLGRVPKDWDFTTSAHPDQIQALFPESFCNNDYGTVGIKNEEEEEQSKKNLLGAEVNWENIVGEHLDLDFEKLLKVFLSKSPNALVIEKIKASTALSKKDMILKIVSLPEYSLL